MPMIEDSSIDGVHDEDRNVDVINRGRDDENV
jgi:hypothetical protein